MEDRARRRLGMAPLDLTDAALERVVALAGSDAPWPRWPTCRRTRDAVRMRVVEERGYGEIALAAHTSESVVRKRVSRGLAGMRARLEEKP